MAQARALLEWHAKHKYCGVCGRPTRSIEGGSKRQCTNAAPPKTDAVPATGISRHSFLFFLIYFLSFAVSFLYSLILLN
jgi:NADH pyrophosphatase NudC (nudix superfamily)